MLLSNLDALKAKEERDEPVTRKNKTLKKNCSSFVESALTYWLSKEFEPVGISMKRLIKSGILPFGNRKQSYSALRLRYSRTRSS